MVIEGERIDELKDELRRIFKGLDMVGPDEAKVFATYVVEYPSISLNLPPILIDSLPDISEKSIENHIKQLKDIGVFEELDSSKSSRIKEPISYENYPHFLLEWLKVNGNNESVEKFKEIKNLLNRRLKSFEEERLEEYIQRIPIAGSVEGRKTYEEDLQVGEKTHKTIISAFSLETQRDLIEKNITEGLERGKDYQLLLVHPELAKELEKPRHGGVVEEGVDFLEGLRRKSDKKPGSLDYRLVKDKEYSHFRGLLKKSSDEKERTYRIFVKKPGERGVVSPIIRGKGETTIYKITEEYFEKAWENSFEPGIIGFLKRYWKKGIVLAILLLFISLWIGGVIPVTILSVILAFFLPLATSVYSDLL